MRRCDSEFDPDDCLALESESAPKEQKRKWKKKRKNLHDSLALGRESAPKEQKGHFLFEEKKMEKEKEKPAGQLGKRRQG